MPLINENEQIDFENLSSGQLLFHAWKGNAIAQYCLGTALCEGNGTVHGNKDMQGGLIWLKKAADQDLPDANFELGKYHLGRSEHTMPEKVDEATALAHFESAARGGHSDAMEWLSDLYDGASMYVVIDKKKSNALASLAYICKGEGLSGLYAVAASATHIGLMVRKELCYQAGLLVPEEPTAP